MSRRVPWRRVCPDVVSVRIERANQARIYLLRQAGPTGFLVKEDGEERTFKVFLGDLHSCTCQTFMKEKELCLHILWVLLKKFRVPKENPVVFQLSLVEREINEVLRGCFVRPGRGQSGNQATSTQDHREKLKARDISSDDVCPICQEELLEKAEPLTFCKYGCGNSVHIKCMKVWAEHQRSTGETIVKCPLCRVDFGTFQELMDEFHKSSRRKTRADRQDLHLGAVCKKCGTCPIAGKCYRCIICADYHLCHKCFATDAHSQHSFQSREKPSQRWRPASRPTSLPSAVAQAMQSRELSEEDYDLLLQLDRPLGEQQGLPGHVISSLPSEVLSQTHPLVSNSSKKCGICLEGYQAFQHVRTLPCQHHFHRNCIDGWLCNHASCPTDGSSVVTVGSGGPAKAAGAGTGLGPRGVPKGLAASQARQPSRRGGEESPHLPSGFTLSGLGLRVSRTRVSGSSLVSSPHSTRVPNPDHPPPVGVAARGPPGHLVFDPLSSKPPLPVASVERQAARSFSGGTKAARKADVQRQRPRSLDRGQRSNSLGDLMVLANGTSVAPAQRNNKSQAIKHSRHMRRGSLGRRDHSRPSHSDSDVSDLGAIVASGISVRFQS